MKVIDLSKKIYSGMTVYPGDPEVEIRQVQTIEETGWNLSKLSMGSHTGTHVDAYSHMCDDGKTIDQISLDHFLGYARVISTDDLHPKCDGVVYDEGTVDDVNLDLAIKYRYKFIAVGNRCAFSAKVESGYLKRGIVTVTDLINVDKVPANKQFLFVAAPLKLSECDGSPVRAFAIVE